MLIKRIDIESLTERKKIFIPFHKQWIQITSEIPSEVENKKFAVFEIPWREEFAIEAIYDGEGNVIKKSYLEENFDFLLQECFNNTKSKK